MPQLFKVGAWSVYFWSNEGQPLEPVHVHVALGRPTPGATKIWLLADGTCAPAGESDVAPATLRRLMSVIESNRDYVVQAWVERFGEAKFADEA